KRAETTLPLQLYGRMVIISPACVHYSILLLLFGRAPPQLQFGGTSRFAKSLHQPLSRQAAAGRAINFKFSQPSMRAADNRYSWRQGIVSHSQVTTQIALLWAFRRCPSRHFNPDYALGI